MSGVTTKVGAWITHLSVVDLLTHVPGLMEVRLKVLMASNPAFNLLAGGAAEAKRSSHERTRSKIVVGGFILD